MRAHYEAARDAYRPVLARIAKVEDPWLERVVKNHVATVELCLGDYSAAMEYAQGSLELCRRYGDRAREGDALCVGGIVLLEVGRYDDAAARFAEALDLLARTSSRWSHTDCLIYAGACEVRRGQARGFAMLDSALADARKLSARYLEANALVTRAAAHLRTGAIAPALDDAAAGTTVARDATLVGYEIQGLARHALGLARIGGVTEGLPLARRAAELLDAQRYLEGSEEDVLVTCAEVMRMAGEDDAAVMARARAGYQRKLAGLAIPAWRVAFAAIPEHATLVS
jgi:tetratricopeptide (TPR) repeat protein